MLVDILFGGPTFHSHRVFFSVGFFRVRRCDLAGAMEMGCPRGNFI